MIRKTIRTMILAAAAATVGIVATPLVAMSKDTTADKEARISWSELVGKIEQGGYKIHEIEEKRNGWKAEVLDKNNRRMELFYDRKGNVTRQKTDH